MEAILEDVGSKSRLDLSGIIMRNCHTIKAILQTSEMSTDSSRRSRTYLPDVTRGCCHGREGILKILEVAVDVLSGVC